jgi:tRNA1(Val) A37 N6-methylase TrmN6
VPEPAPAPEPTPEPDPGPDPGPEPETTLDGFLGHRLRLRQPLRGFRSGTDALLLAAAVPARPGDSALELGCGAGAAILCLGARVPGLALAGLELQPAYAALARDNAARNALPLEVFEGDVERPPPALRARAFDHVLLNPPFFDRAATTRARDPGRDLAHGGPAPLSAWLGLAARRLRPGGALTAIHRAAGLPALLAALPPTLGSVQVLPLEPRPGESPATLLLRARKGGRAPFRLLAPLALHDGAPGPDGKDFSPWARDALERAAPIPWR